MAKRRRWRWLVPADRERVLARVRAGERVADVAAAFDVGVMTVYRIRDEGALASRRVSHSGFRLSFQERVEIAMRVTRRQVCWSHLQRDFRRHADGLAEQQLFGQQGVPLTAQVFAAWRAYQHEHHDRQQLQAEITPVQAELRELLEAASPKKARNRWHRQFANNLLKIWPALWTFTTTDGVEPTNNPAERALRSPVIHRKLSLGTQSENGERFAERALSVAVTCRMQHRSLFTYLSELITSHTRGDPFPALTC